MLSAFTNSAFEPGTTLFLVHCERSLHRAPAKHFTGSVSAYIDDALSKGISQVSSPCST